LVAERPPRADALRNRAQILETAEVIITERGFDVPVSVIAKEVGVGVGTVYRHFPTKEALFAAILAKKMKEVAAAVDRYADAEDVETAFRDFLAYMIERTITDRSLYDGLAAVTGIDLGPDSDLGSALYAAQGRLLKRAQAAGVVRPDLDASDLKAFLAGCIVMAEHGTEPARVIEIVTQGLQSRP
jgi:AcrR family transcriptional regulator